MKLYNWLGPAENTKRLFFFDGLKNYYIPVYLRIENMVIYEPNIPLRERFWTQI